MRNPGTDRNLFIRNITKNSYNVMVDPPENGIIRKHDEQVSTYIRFCLDLSYTAS